MSKILNNTTGAPITIIDVGAVIVPALGSYTIPPQDYLLWAASSDIIAYLNDAATPSIIVNDGSVDLNPSDGMDLIKGLYPRLYVYNPEPDSNPSILVANVEQSYTFPVGMRSYFIQNREGGAVKWSYVSGQSGVVYNTLRAGSWIALHNYAGPTLSFYYQSATVGTVLEISSWT